MEVITSEAVARKNGRATAPDGDRITIRKLNIQHITLDIVGTAPYMQLRFSEKAREAMRAKMLSGSKARSRNREARDFDADYESSMYITSNGQRGIPAAAFRNAAIDACRMAGYPMTKAKCSIFVRADDADLYDETPLVHLTGTPHRNDATVRNATGVADIRIRARWESWSARLLVAFDADQFGVDDVVNLFARAGAQVGIGEGRPFSKASNGLGLGTFELLPAAEATE